MTNAIGAYFLMSACLHELYMKEDGGMQNKNGNTYNEKMYEYHNIYIYIYIYAYQIVLSLPASSKYYLLKSLALL